MKSLSRVSLFPYITALVLTPLAHSQFLQQGSKLVGSGALSAGASQGSAVALSADGNTAVSGAANDNAVWVFTRTNGVWSQQGARLSGTGGSVAAGQGWSAALSADGKTMIVGGPFDNNAVGASWIFVRGADGVWTQQGGKLTANDAVGAAEQGYAVALSADGNTALVGAALDNGGLGATWVFTRNGSGVWTQQGPKLVGSGSVGASWQGNGVGLSADGNTAVTGGPFDANFLGATWVFTRANGTWTQQGPKLVGTGAAGAPYQGQSVALSADGNTMIVGGPFDTLYQIGAAWVFNRNGNGVWSQQGPKLVAGDAAGFPAQGQSVAISADGNTAVVGGPNDNNNQGAAWVYTRSNGVWAQSGAKLKGTGAVGSSVLQGQSVAISGDHTTILSGGIRDTSNLGAAWVFEQVHLALATPAAASSGIATNFTATVLQPDNLPYAGTSGAIHFTSSDAAATLPADATLNGPTTLTATFRTAGIQTITATDQARPSLAAVSSAIAVSLPGADAATHFSVSTAATASAGVGFSVIVTALTAGNNPAAGYSGTVHFTSSDGTATLPANSTLVNGVGAFVVTLRTIGTQSVTVADAANAAVTGTSGPIAVGAPAAISLSPRSVEPSSGNSAGAFMAFAFTDPRGANDLGVVNILINRVLDGRGACYLAYSQPQNVLYLLDDNGVISPQIPGAVLTASGSLSNSQCTVAWGGPSPFEIVTVVKNGVNLILTLNITFKQAFGGDKVIYMAARDVAENNSGWQPKGVWRVPGAAPVISTAVVGMTPARGEGLGPAVFTFSFSDTKGANDLGVVNILVNDAIDGRHACYVAYSRPLNVLYLVNDNGDGLLEGQRFDVAGTTSNSQCTISWGALSAATAGNNLTLTVNLAFKPGFAGNRVFYLAARDSADANNTDWQPSGTWTVQ